MSAEHFFRVNREDESFREAFSVWREQRIQAAGAPTILFEQILKEAGSAMHDTIARRDSRGGTAMLPSNINASPSFNNAALHFSAIGMELERSIWEGEFSADAVIDIIYNAINGARDIPRPKGFEGTEIISEEKRAQMVMSANSDKTLSIFFENPDYLPGLARTALIGDENAQKRYKVMLSKVLPEYKRLAEVIIPQNTNSEIKLLK